MTTVCSGKKPCKRSDCPDCQHDRFRKQLEMRREIEKEYGELLQQAHRAGWEQGKAEAKALSFICSCHKAIAALEYKEKAND